SVAITAPGSGTPAGNVTVSDGTLSCTGTVAAGNCSLTFTSVGTKSLTATYAGNTNFGSSTSSVESHLVKANSLATMASSPNPSVFGQAVTLAATVTAVAPASGTPTGTVSFDQGGTNFGTASLNGAGQASIIIS